MWNLRDHITKIIYLLDRNNIMKILKKRNIECPYWSKNNEQNKGTENNKNSSQYN